LGVGPVLAVEAQEHRRPDGRVAGKGQFPAGREDAQLRPVAALLGGQDEDGFGEVELAGDRLHRVTVEPLPVEDDGQRIAREPAGREHVERGEAAAHEGPLNRGPA
jgi:hypothetical protein